ncbi:MAG TPA: sulfotransferase [Pirellulales bacterium]
MSQTFIDAATQHQADPFRLRPERNSRPENLPSLFVVGAAKSGTTALYHYFKLHPNVFVPTVKEVNYMAFFDGLPPLAGPGDRDIVARRSVTKFEDYQRLFATRTTESVAADVSPGYLQFSQTAGKIAELCPSAKIAIVLRNPVECAFSMYSMLRRDRREPCRTFRQAFALSEKRISARWDGCWDYRGAYLFADQVHRYLTLFPRSQMFIRRYEELQDKPAQFYQELCKFIGIPEIDVEHANQRLNVACTRRDLIRTRKMGRWMMRTAHVAGLAFPSSIKTPIRRYLKQPAFELTSDDRRMLIDHFAPDVLRLGQLLGWDLRRWLEA